MGLLSGRNRGTQARNEPVRRKVRKCTHHGNALPCWKCKKVAEQVKTSGTGPTKCGKCGKTMRGGVCPGAFC